MAYIVKAQQSPRSRPHYIKFTCRFGCFHGSIVLTDKKEEARKWTRKKDAERAAWVAGWRAEKYPEDNAKIAGFVFSVE